MSPFDWLSKGITCDKSLEVTKIDSLNELDFIH